MTKAALAAALIAGMAGQYLEGKAPAPDEDALAKLQAPADLGPKLAAEAAALGSPRRWDCRLEKLLGVADERLTLPDEGSASLNVSSHTIAARRAEAEAYWRGRAVVYDLERQNARGARAALDPSAVEAALNALLAAEPELSAGKTPPDGAALDHYANSASRRLREVAASVPPRKGWRCHDVERALWVLDNAASRMMKNQPAAAAPR